MHLDQQQHTHGRCSLSRSTHLTSLCMSHISSILIKYSSCKYLRLLHYLHPMCILYLRKGAGIVSIESLAGLAGLENLRVLRILRVLRVCGSCGSAGLAGLADVWYFIIIQIQYLHNVLVCQVISLFLLYIHLIKNK